MVLQELGERITGALSKLSNRTVIDQEALESMLKEIGAYRCNLYNASLTTFSQAMHLCKLT